jgi:hypothetical protein
VVGFNPHAHRSLVVLLAPDVFPQQGAIRIISGSLVNDGMVFVISGHGGDHSLGGLASSTSRAGGAGGVITPETALWATDKRLGYTTMTQFASAQPCPTSPPPALLRIDDNPDDLLLFQLAWEKSLAANPIHCIGSCKEAIE